jgi:hypothetical protein
MDEFLNNIWSENNYPAKTKLLKLAQASNPAVKAKDVETQAKSRNPTMAVRPTQLGLRS